MAENLSPYMIPKPLDLQIFHSLATKEHDPKSSTTNSATPALNELQNLLNTSATAYIANFKVDSRIPYYVHHNFDRDMELFSRQLSVQVANTYDTFTRPKDLEDGPIDDFEIDLTTYKKDLQTAFDSLRALKSVADFVDAYDKNAHAEGWFFESIIPGDGNEHILLNVYKELGVQTSFD